MLNRHLLPVVLIALLVTSAWAQTVSYHSATGAQHQAHVTNLSASGHRMISLSIHGTPANPRYAAVWVVRAGPLNISFHGLDGAQYQTFISTWCPQGYTPKILTAVGTLANSIFAGVFELTNDTCLAFHGLSETGFWDQVGIAGDADMQVVTMDLYGDAADPRYIVSFGPKKFGLGVRISTSVADMQSDADAYIAGHARPALVAFNDDDRFVSLWRSDDVGSWVMHHDMSWLQYINLASNYELQGLDPILLHASGIGFGTRYVAVWANSDQPTPGGMTVTGQPVPEMAMFDIWAQDFMSQAEVRSANLAIVRNGRLVYARAFTAGGPNYRITQPTDVYRIASCSKPITSIATHQHFWPGSSISPSDSMTTFMPNTVAVDNWVSAIKIDHLLTHMPGWITDYTRRYESSITGALGVTLPLTKRNTYDYVTQIEFLDYYPGQGSAYCNLGFNILGQIIEELNPGLSYEQYVNYNIFAPLGIWRGRLGGSLKSQIPPEEVFYHPYNPSIRKSPVNALEPLVSQQYGGENIPIRDAQGGWVMAAADYAKILSAFDLPSNPILNQTQTNSMWTLAPGTSGTLRGWSLGSATDQNGQPIALRGHNGRLDGSRSLIVRRDDGLSFVWFCNGDKMRTSVGTHGRQLSDLANTVAVWPNHDLFPSLGLPSSVNYAPGTASYIGNGCQGAGGVLSLHVLDAPDIGQPVQFQISRAPNSAPSLLLIGLNSLNVSLAPLGAPGCSAYCDPVVMLNTIASATGSGAFFDWLVPDVPAALGSIIYAQGACLDPTANALGLTTSNGRGMTLGGWQ
ncbi:MAG: CubicO group peptidase (beta-lactamase class C family) [Planctomycetota bacterium]|jgi:CubicO group peptidase (beta-lactamase class C family)